MGKPIALITGASAGIGAAFARALAGRGYDLVLVARRRERLEALAAEIGGSAEIIQADLTQPAELARVEARLAAEPRVDLLVNNAGFGVAGRFWESDAEKQTEMHLLHIVALMRLTHAALGPMVAANRGAIINVSSVAGFVHSPGSVTYSASKTWINSFTEGLELDLKSRGSAVKMQALCPGYTHSDFHDVAGIDKKTIPEALWLPAEMVVEDSLRGLERSELFVVPGWRYQWLVRLLRVLPAAWVRKGSVWYARRIKRT
ncbi:MAG TPA: SDR family oxidoreductase [Bryobacteraceae bacterium]|nr:SDR family oxidoreductase [Bryobacteraceae bacterium]